MIEIALKIAAEAHQGQKDLGGDFYILHPLRLMAKMKTTDEKIVAILHDVIEDSECHLADIGAHGFSNAVQVALDRMTKKRGEKYTDYIKRIATNSIARKVKLADLDDNMDVRRLFALTDRDYKRLSKYQEAWAYLMAC